MWPYALIFWAVELWVFYPEFGVMRRAKASEKDAKSFQVIMIGLNLAFFLAFLVAWFPILQITSHRVFFFGAGVLLMIAGSLLRRHCFRMLGASFTGDVRATPDQQVVTRGAYSLLRHPSYSAALMVNLGCALALGSWAAVIMLLAASTIVYSYRIAVEERALRTTIGEPYERFMSGRKRLIPFIY